MDSDECACGHLKTDHIDAGCLGFVWPSGHIIKAGYTLCMCSVSILHWYETTIEENQEG